MADKKITRADTKTMYSFVLPRGDALNKEAQRQAVAAFYGIRPSDPLSEMASPIMQRIRAMPVPHPAQVYSYGGRDYPSFEAAKRANPDMVQVSNPPNGHDPGARAERLSKAMEYSKYAHDGFGALAEAGGGRQARSAFGPLGKALDAVGGGSTLTASLQRGEPVDVAIARAAAPIVGGALGEAVGTAGGAVIGGSIGSVVPGPGTLVGGTEGGIIGGLAGSYGGGKLGEAGADLYAKARRYRW